MGRNCVIELDFAIDRDGLVADTHAARYRQFGQWIASCYGPGPEYNNAAVAATSGVLAGNSTALPANSSLTLTVPASNVDGFDRMMIQEDLAHGQRIRSYTVSAFVDGNWKVLASGNSVGNKRIDLLPSAVSTTQVKLEVTANQAAPVYIRHFGVYSCV